MYVAFVWRVKRCFIRKSCDEYSKSKDEYSESWNAYSKSWDVCSVY